MRITLLFGITMMILSCSSLKTPRYNLDNLNQEQWAIAGPGKGESGRCYAKMKTPQGDVLFHQIICPSRLDKETLGLIKERLSLLGYSVQLDAAFGAEDREALIDFQKSEGLAHGNIDEATLYRLLLRTNDMVK